MKELEIGRLLRAGMEGFVAGCRVTQLDIPSFGALVRVPLTVDYQIYGLIYDIHVDDDGLVRQLVTAGDIDDNVIADNRQNRNIPIEISVLTVGYQEETHISHLLPPRPALSLDRIYLCDNQELVRFTDGGRFGYFRHILYAKDLNIAELIAAHFQQADRAHRVVGNDEWASLATESVILTLRDDYHAIMHILSALSDIQS